MQRVSLVVFLVISILASFVIFFSYRFFFLLQYLVTVVAEDGGGRAGTGTVTIYVDDDNDMAPVFKKKIFRKKMSEGEPSGASSCFGSEKPAEM